MSIKLTRSTKDLKQMTIDSLGLSIENEKQQGSIIEDVECVDVDADERKMGMNKFGPDVTEKYALGHELDDQRLFPMDKSNSSLFQTQLRTIKKFDGCGDAEQWLKHIYGKFDAFQLTSIERNILVPEILTGEAIIWYVKQQDKMPTFIAFMKKFLQDYGPQELTQETATLFTSSSTRLKSPGMSECKDTIMDSLRTQMLMNNLEKLPKFTGKSKQNVATWLREIQQAMHTFKLRDEEKFFFVPSCLEAEARDWFFENTNLFSTWNDFMKNLIKTFESSGKADISFNRLRHYEQGIAQDVRQYYFEILKLCKEANPDMDEASKLQYLKAGLKPSLRFDILLKNPQTPEDFLEYAQKVEELKSLDEKQDINGLSEGRKFASSSSVNRRSTNIKSQQLDSLMSITPDGYDNTSHQNYYPYNESNQQVTTTTPTKNHYDSGIPKPPYRCYKCGGSDHFIRNCPHFQ